MSLFVTVLALSFVLFTDSASAEDTKILVDPGHGGNDPGSQGNGLKEKDVTLDISKRINSVLNSNYDVSTKMTRNSDKTVSLNNRTSVANSWGADLFLSVHINAGGGSGYEDYIHSSLGAQSRSIKRYDTTSPKVQAAIRAEVNKVLDKYGIRDRGAKQANFHVLRESGMPAVLLEIMFIDTKKDADSLKNNNFKQDMAVGISKGVANAYRLKAENKPDKPSTSDIWTAKDNKEYLVTATNLNIRSGNSTQYGVVGTISNNKTIKAIGKTSNGWIKFKHKGKDAFVSGSLLKDKPKASKPEPDKSNNAKTHTVKSGETLYSIGVENNVSVNNLKKWNNLSSNIISVNQKLNTSSKSNVDTTREMTVTASLINVRDKATMNGSKVIDKLSKGTKVDVKKKYNKYWYQIDLNGKSAYVSSKHIK